MIRETFLLCTGIATLCSCEYMPSLNEPPAKVRTISKITTKYTTDSTKSRTYLFTYDAEARLTQLKMTTEQSEETQKFTYHNNRVNYRYTTDWGNMKLTGSYRIGKYDTIDYAEDLSTPDSVTVTSFNHFIYKDNKIDVIQSGVRKPNYFRAPLAMKATWEGNDLTQMTSNWTEITHAGGIAKYRASISKTYNTEVLNQYNLDLNYFLERSLQNYSLFVFDALISGKCGQKSAHMMSHYHHLVEFEDQRKRSETLDFTINYEKNTDESIKEIQVITPDNALFMTMTISYL